MIKTLDPQSPCPAATWRSSGLTTPAPCQFRATSCNVFPWNHKEIYWENCTLTLQVAIEMVLCPIVSILFPIFGRVFGWLLHDFHGMTPKKISRYGHRKISPKSNCNYIHPKSKLPDTSQLPHLGVTWRHPPDSSHSVAPRKLFPDVKDS